MLRELLRILITIPHRLVQLVKWIINPKNGDEFVTPFRRHYLTTGVSFVVTILYHLLAGAYTVITEYLIGAIAQILHIVKDIVLDLWRANPSYSRWAARSALALGVFIASGVAVMAIIALKSIVAVMVAILNALR